MHVGGRLVGATRLDAADDSVTLVHDYAVAVTPADVLDPLVEAEMRCAVILTDARSMGGSRTVGAEGGVDEVLLGVSIVGIWLLLGRVGKDDLARGEVR